MEELVKLATEELRVPFGTALKEGDIKELAFIKGQVAPAVLSLFAAFRKTLLSPKPRLYFSASSFEALELWADCCVALGEDASQPLGAAVKAVEAVSPGSDLHAILAARQQDLAARTHGADSTQAAAARQAAVRAHVLRYGATSESVTEQLVKANLTLYS